MKTVMSAGMENSGTKMLFRLLKQHPEIIPSHTSLPGCWMPDTHMPSLDPYDFIAWIVRYERFRLSGVKRRGYDMDRPPWFIPPGLYENCKNTYRHILHKTIFIPYEGIIGPFQEFIMERLMDFCGLPHHTFDFSEINDENAKYLTGCDG